MTQRGTEPWASLACTFVHETSPQHVFRRHLLLLKLKESFFPHCKNKPLGINQNFEPDWQISLKICQRGKKIEILILKQIILVSNACFLKMRRFCYWNCFCISCTTKNEAISLETRNFLLSCDSVFSGQHFPLY